MVTVRHCVSGWGVLEVNALAGVVFSGLSVLVIEGVADEGELVRVVARTRDDPVPCPVCGTPTGRVHGFHGRTVAVLREHPSAEIVCRDGSGAYGEAIRRALCELTAACPEMTELARLVKEFAELLTPATGNDTKLTEWITAVRACDLPHLHTFANGLELDRAAVNAGLTHPHHGVNTRTKRITRQMHGRAGFPLLRHRILLQ